MRRRTTLSLPDLTRQSILLRKKMDARVKPAHDELRVSVFTMKRRKFISLVGAAAATAVSWPRAARAQQPVPNAARIGWLKIQGPRHTPGQLQAFRGGLRALGLVEGRDYVLEERYAGGHESQLPTLTSELLGTGVRIIVATSQPSIIAAARVTKGVPIIGRMVDDPVTTGLARSLARPGGNVTGIYTMTEEMNPKRLNCSKRLCRR
jgi:putative tryptophan/tyrosine transport system substrate-binding protein